MGSCANKSQLQEIVESRINNSKPVNRMITKNNILIDINLGPDIKEAASAEIREVSKSSKDLDLIKNSLKKHFIFNSLSQSYVSILIHHMRLYTLKAEEIVFTQGSPASNFYVISKGKIEIKVNNKRIKLLSPGDSFGETALLHNTARTASVCTITASSLWVLDRKTFRSTLKLLEQANYEENKAFIDSISLFEVLSRSQKESLVHSLTTHSFVPGSVIVNEGDPGDLFYIIKQGLVAVTKNGQEVRKMGKGFYFGEQALLYTSVRTATVSAVDHVSCVAISGNELNEILGTKFQDVIYINSLRISLEKNYILKKLTRKQIDDLANCVNVLTFASGEKIAEKGQSKKKAFWVILKGELVDKTGTVGKVFDVFNVESVVNDLGDVFIENVSAAEETTLAVVAKEAFEKSLGGSFGEITANNEALKILKRIQILRGLSFEEVENLIKVLKVQEFKEGSFVVTQNDPGESFFIVKSGKAEVIKDGNVVRTITKHDYFGERSLLFNNFRSATVKAKSNLICWVMEKSEFSSLLEDSIRKQLLTRIDLQDDTVKFEDLLIIKQLGSGMFGNVFLVVNKTTRALYALKSVDRRKIAGYEIQENLVLERKILLELDHIFIMKMVRTFKDQFRVYFLLEFIQGMDLFDVIRELGVLNDSDTRFYSACLLNIIEHLHEREIIYRDLKPENIVIDEEGYPKLIDFGTAKFIKSRTFTIVGTPHYMAPEVVTGHGYSLSADLWSLGVIVYEFLFGKVPFGEEDSDPYIIYEKVQKEPVEFPKWSDKKSLAKDLILQLLNKSSVKRLPGGFDNLKIHNWFRGLDWDHLLSKKLKSPFEPKVLSYKNESETAIRNNKSVLEVIARIESKTEPPAPRSKSKIPEFWDKDF